MILYFGALLSTLLWVSGCGSKSQSSKEKSIAAENGTIIGLIPSFDDSAFLYLRCRDSTGFEQTRLFYKEKYRVAFSVKKFALTQNCLLPIETELYKENLEEARQFIRADIAKNAKKPNMFLAALSELMPSLHRKLQQEQLVKEDWLEIMLQSLNELDKNQTAQISEYLFVKIENYFSYVLNRTLAVDEKSLEIFGMNHIAYEMGLTALLQSRCLHYQGIKMANLSCFNLAKDMVSDLDFSLMGEASAGKAFISFTRELHELIPLPTTNTYLAALLAKFEESRLSGDLPRFNVYNWTKQFLRSDELSLKFMATFFQDYVLLAQLNYLKMASFPKKTRSMAMANINLIEKILAIAIQQPRTMGFEETDDIEASGDRGYHFFVPAYLAYKLRKRGYNARLAATMPFVFNTIYEYAREINVSVFALVRDIQWSPYSPGKWLNIPSDVWKNFISLFNLIDDPVTLVRWQDLGTMEDIYYGYAGASFGATFPETNFLSYGQFFEEFSPSPKTFMIDYFF